MFKPHTIEAQNNCVVIKDCEHTVVKKMIEYCENFTIKTFDNVIDIFQIAHKYQIERLVVSSMSLNIIKKYKTFRISALKKWQKLLTPQIFANT